MPVYYNMQNQQKMIQTRQNGQNPHLRAKIRSVPPKFGPEFFSRKSGSVTFSTHSRLTSCKTSSTHVTPHPRIKFEIFFVLVLCPSFSKLTFLITSSDSRFKAIDARGLHAKNRRLHRENCPKSSKFQLKKLSPPKMVKLAENQESGSLQVDLKTLYKKFQFFYFYPFLGNQNVNKWGKSTFQRSKKGQRLKMLKVPTQRF